MTTFRSVLFAAVCLAVLLGPSAPAQTPPFTISTYQGNGQMICSGCTNWPYYLQSFQTLVAKVVDATGAPVVSTTVNWSMYGNGGLSFDQTVTDTNGLTTNLYAVNPLIGTPSTPYIASQVYAAVGTSTATFYLTQALASAGNLGAAKLVTDSISAPASISGSAGSTGPAITVQIGSTNGYVSGIEVRLVSAQASPSVSCAPGPAGSPVGDPGTVLTDNNGSATCNPILAGSGSGSVFVLLGGVTNNPGANNGTGGPSGYDSTYWIPLTVSAPSPGSIQATGGNNQNVTAGQALPTLLTAIVKDTKGNSISGQAVNWSVSPAGSGTFTYKSTVSDSNGQVQNGFTLSGTANGNITITAAIAGTSLVPATFSETAVQMYVPTNLQKVSGDSPVQSVASGQPFPNPLVVQVYLNNGQAASGVTVNFSVSGPASFTTPSTPTTDSFGRAQVSLVALTTTSQTQVTVTASVGSVTPVTFQLTVIPPGPTINPSSFVNAADQKVGSVSPCSLATVIGPGIAPSVQGTLVGASFGPGPTSLAGDSITFTASGNTVQAPIFSIANNSGTQSMTFQVPCEVTAGTLASVAVSVSGGSAPVNLSILAASPGVYQGTDGRALLVRQDGSFVSPANPARLGETVTAFVTGLGPTTPSVGTNQLPPRGAVATVNGTVVPGVAGGGASLYAFSPPQLTPDLVGVYTVSFVIPANAPTNNNNVGFSIGVIPVGAVAAVYSNLTFIAIGH